MPPRTPRSTRPRPSPSSSTRSTPPPSACWRARPRRAAPGSSTTAPTTSSTAAAARPGPKTRRPRPLSVYGRSKLEGEEADPRERLPPPDLSHQLGLRARAATTSPRRCCAWRATRDRAHGHRRPDRRADRRRAARRRHRARLPRRRRHGPSCRGTYHAVAAGETSWHGYARHVIDFARERGEPLRVRRRRDRGRPDRRLSRGRRRGRRIPGSTRRKLRDAFDLTLPPWQARSGPHARRSARTEGSRMTADSDAQGHHPRRRLGHAACIRRRSRSASSCCRCTTSRWSTTRSAR